MRETFSLPGLSNSLTSHQTVDIAEVIAVTYLYLENTEYIC